MTDPASPASPADRPASWILLLYRCATLATVVLGGWCLWLAFAATPRPIDVEAQHEQQSETKIKSHSAPPKLMPSQQEGRLIAEITDVSESIDADDESKVVTAVQQEVIGTNTYPVKAISHSAQRPESKSSAAWLTGTIDEEVDAVAAVEAVAPEALGEIPAWKRTSKSLKRLLKTTSTAAERH